MSRQQAQLMDAWDRMYPVEQWECTRAQRVEALQGNENLFVKRPCQDAGLW
ncbi:endonuclease [uncultured Bilophila sp.]|nr:endonuclease [uncultured Bilophila sp.]